MGLLQRCPGNAVEPRWADNDAAERSALHRSAGNRLDRTCRLGSGRRVNPPLALVDHGWAVRRKVSERIRAARCCLWATQSAVAGLRPHVLQRDALQRCKRCRSKDDVLRTLSLRAPLEVPDQTRETSEVRGNDGRKGRKNSAGDPCERERAR